MDDLLADFLTEVSEGLGELDNAVLLLEERPGDARTLQLIFRQVHTIKGTCGFLGLARLERVAHAAEDVLGRVRDGELHPSAPIIDRILAALDRIKSIVAGIAASGGDEPGGDDADLVAALRAIAEAPPPDVIPPAAPPPPPLSPEQPRPAPRASPAGSDLPARSGLSVCSDPPVPLDPTLSPVLDVSAILHVPPAPGVWGVPPVLHIPPAAEVPRVQHVSPISVVWGVPSVVHTPLAAEVSPVQHVPPIPGAPPVQPALPHAPVSPVLPEPSTPRALLVPPARPAPPAPASLLMPPAPPAEPESERKTSDARTVRVGVDLLDHLMTLAGELVLTRNQLVLQSRDRHAPENAAPLDRLSRLTAELQESVMKARMQPIGAAWNKLPRLVRDLGLELGKRIELVTVGADTELDRQVLEQICDPLTHLVRNAADHGLETPAEREAAGKPATGCITLRARHDGGAVLLEIADDGRGLDIGRIRAKAGALGLVTEAELAGMTDAQIGRFVFAAGFSTAPAVTALSGRGVGMDVVRHNVERVGGTIDIGSTAGCGTTIAIRIPLTLAIVPGLLVRASGQRFVLPQGSVVELVGSADANRHVVCGAELLSLRGATLPLAALATLLGLPADPARQGGCDPAPSSTSAASSARSSSEPPFSSSPSSRPASGVVVVVQASSGSFGLAVDAVLDTEEIVVKPMAPSLRHIAAFGGVAICGDGAVSAILDPAGLARMIGLARAGGAEGRVAAAARGDPAPAAGRTPDQGSQTLLFQSGDRLCAVRLAAVARLELVARTAVEGAPGHAVMQYRGRLLPLARPHGRGRPLPASEKNQPVIVLAGNEAGVGLLADRIVDIVDEEIVLEPRGAAPGMAGVAILAGHTVDVIDPVAWARAPHPDGCSPTPHPDKPNPTPHPDGPGSTPTPCAHLPAADIAPEFEWSDVA